MWKEAISLRRATVAVVVATALVLPMLSVAQADQSTEQAQATKPQPKKHAARTPRKQPQTAPHELFGSVQQSWAEKRCTWPYQNQYPPCMSTWPAGDPNYHGSSHPGPTFDSPF